MTWQSTANKQVTEPVVLIVIDFSSGPRCYSATVVRSSGHKYNTFLYGEGVYDGNQIYKNKLLNMPQVVSSIGDVARTYERNKITLIMDDADYEFRTLEDTETVKFLNRDVFVSVFFGDDSFLGGQRVYTGQIFEWERLDNLQYKFEVEEKSTNLENEFPDVRVDLSDWADADETAIGWSVQIPYGTISAIGLSGDGAFGHPSLSQNDSGTGLLFVDTSNNAEKHLVGMQETIISVPRVYKDGALQTEGGGNDYTIGSTTINGFVFTTIDWETGNNPTSANLISCDIIFGSRRPVEAIQHFLTTFAGYSASDFDSDSFTEAKATEVSRGYDFAGALWQPQVLRTILDNWRDQWELDIFWNPSGKIQFKYITSAVGSPNEYNDLLHILSGYKSDIQADELINFIRYGYNKNYAKTYFNNYATVEDTASQTAYGGTRKVFLSLNWTRTANVASDIASRKIIRLKDPATFVSLSFPVRTFTENLANTIKVTHFEGASASGDVDKLYQIRGTNLNLNTFTNEMRLQDSSNFAGQGFILGPDTDPLLWTAASGAQKDNGYLCDPTTQKFSDGVDGKLLID